MKIVDPITPQPHIPVMLNEVVEYLIHKDNQKILDCTFGAGGYSTSILESSTASVTALDQDPTVLTYANKLADLYQNRFSFIQTNFADSIKKLKDLKFDGIVLDLGVSSMQLDSGERGFSFMKDGPLDMRMSNEGITAADFINGASEEEIADVIYKYGGESASRRIAKKIVAQRQLQPITNTGRLTSLVRSVIGHRKGKIDPATKTFQAIRIYINDELGKLTEFLESVQDILAPDGRLVVVSFHSLEDSIVKHFFKARSAKVVAKSKYAPETAVEPNKWLRIMTKKPLSPSKREVDLNPRARSAKLRAASKVKIENYG